MKTFEFAASGFSYAVGFFPEMICVLCHGKGKSFLYRKDELGSSRPLGICEPCSNLSYWTWRQIAGEVSPGSSMEDNCISRIYVILTRRRRVPTEDALSDAPEGEHTIAAPSELCTSWEFMFVEQPDGSLDLPSVSGLSLWNGKHVSVAALRALDDIGLTSWPSLMEPLYSSYTPRGHLVHVVLARGCAAKSSKSLTSESRGCPSWHVWPISAYTGGMAGFWRAMETVWPLRLYKHCAEGLTEEMCVQMREAACRFVELQAAVREGRAADVTMLSALQEGMSPDEIAVARMIQRATEQPEDVRRPSRKRGSPGKGKRSRKEASAVLDSASQDEPEGGEVPGEDDASFELAGDGEAEGDVVEGGEDSLDDSTFAQPKR
jgi:hypothetical protein